MLSQAQVMELIPAAVLTDCKHGMGRRAVWLECTGFGCQTVFRTVIMP